ncbi:deoxyuridine 5'-triphosphate nucleotidohydrolase [Chloroflexota bacterium]
MTVLSREAMLELIKGQPPLIEDYLDLEQQLQPNGFDVTLRDIAVIQSAGAIAVSNDNRVISALSPLAYDGLGYIDLLPGAYVVTFNEIVNIPRDIMALARPRSSLLRCGVSVHNAVWDAGYSGRSQGLLTVYNPLGFRLQRNARIAQMVFMTLSHETEGYRGKYQGENI